MVRASLLLPPGQLLLTGCDGWGQRCHSASPARSRDREQGVALVGLGASALSAPGKRHPTPSPASNSSASYTN